MRQQEIFKKIGVILSELIEQYDYLQEEDNHLNSLELELLLANSNFLTSHVEILYKVNLQNANLLLKGKEFENEQKYFEPVVQHVVYEEEEIEEPFEQELQTEEQPIEAADEIIKQEHDVLIDFGQEKEPDLMENEVGEATNDNEIFFDQIDTTTNEAVKEDLSEENTSNTFESNVINEPVKPEPELSFTEHYDNTKFWNDTNTKENESLTVNQKISSQYNDNNDQALGAPLKELKQGITLNDKLLYVKDLFNGYNLAYSEAIEILNRFSNFEEASKFLNTNYVAKNNWMSKPETVEKFYSVLRRRYL